MHRIEQHEEQSTPQGARVATLRGGGRAGNRAGPGLTLDTASAGDCLDGRTAAELEAQLKTGAPASLNGRE